MAHAWKACWVNALGGSNPPSSASRRARDLQRCGWRALRHDHVRADDPVEVLVAVRPSPHDLERDHPRFGASAIVRGGRTISRPNPLVKNEGPDPKVWS